MKVFRIKFASKLKDGYFYNQNGFKYSKKDFKKIIESGFFNDLLRLNNLFICDINIGNINVHDTRSFIARITDINIEEQYAEILCDRDTYPRSNLLMDNLDCASLGFILSGKFDENKDINGYITLHPAKFIKCQLVLDKSASEPVEMIYNEPYEAHDQRHFDDYEIKKQLKGEKYGR